MKLTVFKFNYLQTIYIMYHKYGSIFKTTKNDVKKLNNPVKEKRGAE
jgi:hypothetical protein